MNVFLTGGSGFIGGYVAEVLRSRGDAVVALSRGSSDTSHLRRIGAEIAEGDVTNQASIEAAMQGADVVIHAAAVVGGYGSWRHFEAVGVRGTAHVVRAAERTGARRFIHVGSIAVYGTTPRGRIYTESTPFEDEPAGWNHYVREKVVSERLLWEAHGAGRIAATSLRPSSVVGAGDRNFLPRIRSALAFRLGAIVGDGENEVPLVTVGEVAEAIVRAAEVDATAGAAYNLSGSMRITQRDIFDIVADESGIRRLTRTISFPAAMRSAALLEGAWKLVRRRREPPITRFGVAVIGQHYEIDCTRAAADLGWRGQGDCDEALRQSARRARDVERTAPSRDPRFRR